MARHLDISGANMAASLQTKKKIAVVGDGLSAGLVIWNLDWLGFDLSEIIIFGTGRLGSGKAYGSKHPDLRLNVRADLMNVTHGTGPDFETWAEDHIDDPDADTPMGRFYRRWDFGLYMDHLLSAIWDKGITVIKSPVQGLTPPRDGSSDWQIITENEVFSAENVVLALGNPDAEPAFDVSTRQLITAPWQATWPEQIDPDDEIAIIGGGLTAMDAILILHQQNHKGPVHLIIPQGQLPPCQAAWVNKISLAWPKLGTASEFIKVMTDHLPQHSRETVIWQEHFEGLRNGISEAWQQLPRSARLAILKKFGPWWQSSRYRAGPQSSAAAAAMQASGQMDIIASRAHQLSPAEGMLAVQCANGMKIKAHQVILAIGSGRDPFTAALAQADVICHDPMGIAVDSRLNVFSRGGTPHPHLFATGTQTAFFRGDVIGAGGISREAQRVAQQLAEMNNV